jgi:aminoglycoside phosphotransferase family enzyme/predicted kinase
MTTLTRSLPEALLDPEAYPHRPDGVELRETHISWVFLAGEKAYKVKKPVRFAFLNAAALERRHALCRAEVALDRRFAPALYHGVVALVPDGAGGLCVAPEHDPAACEYAVVMSRYDERDTLAARLAARRVTAGDMAAVGAAIAGWHAEAPRAGDGVDRLAAIVEETLDTLAGAGAPPRPLEDLRRFCACALQRFAPELERRERAGFVRDGHGDLRTEHILLGGSIQAVDGLEFDPALRIADVGYDLAFLVMDVARDDDGLARALVRGYRAAGGDPGPEDLLAFLCAVRAMIRAKVDLLRAGQLSGSAAQERMARAHDRLALAERFAWRTRLPHVVCVTGLAASGKSTLAEALAAAAGRTLLSSDRIRKLRAGVDPFERAAPSAYGDVESRAVYAELAQRAAVTLRAEGGVIVEATFRRGADAEAFTGGSAAAATAAWIVCDAPPEVRLERARQRALRGSVSDADERIVAAELAVHHGAFSPPGAPLARLETTRPVAELLEQLARILDLRMGGAP